MREIRQEPPAPVALVLVPALASGDRDEAAIEAATELVVAGGTVLVLHETATEPLREAVLPGPGGQVMVVVGPEVGIADRELDLFRDAGAVLTVLGPHVLRTSTAGPAAVAMLAERLGRWE